ncbi:apolipoprotein N-acyltransferase [Varunaivibrio sulfuroxidans]|uniref:Apolipoprotein N-acyltransferase n=2 Tax=Varunaivibrio sulfuroxidans TaxID=1773489 RepID=A0A4R3JGK0_9PROT|nr:apolipoprotein N-acyltransferase [Varunaivibrio sulfuroxidans]TCS65052.1 apolipoprotein N-acyltransferase [Varunaivibrio sulfuroxidans]
MSLVGVRAWFVGLPPWRRRLALVVCGAAGALAMPPLYLFPLLIVAFVGLFWALDAAPGVRRAFAVGWWWGVGHYAVGLYWISAALLVDPQKFAWLIPFAVVGFSVGMALFPAMVGLCARLWRPTGPAAQLIWMAALWGAFEWVRSWAFTGFPWNLIGTIWAFSDAMIQPAAWIGTYGLGMITVLAATAPAIYGFSRRRRADRTVAFVAWLGLAALGLAGWLRLDLAHIRFFDGVHLRLVQPNIPQRLKWVRGLRNGHVLEQVAMSRRPPPPGTPPPTAVIWAETAVPYFLDGDPVVRAEVARAAPPGGVLITGAVRTAIGKDGKRRVWNSLEAIDRAGRIVATYDKTHLVPFGEYVPFRGILPIEKITAGQEDFSAGTGLRTLRMSGIPPVGPLICYEVIFPDRVTDPTDRPAWLLNITNDSWYGRTSGPYQHLVSARMRAVEEGLAMVRVANTGISAIIDPYGRVRHHLALGRAGVIDGRLPRGVGAVPLYARYGNAVVLAIFLAMVGVSGVLSRRVKV